MIKMCQKEGQCGTYLATARKHRWSVKMTMKNDKLNCLPLQLMKAAVPAESYSLFIILHRHFYSPAMSTGSSQVGAALFPSFNTFLSIFNR